MTELQMIRASIPMQYKKVQEDCLHIAQVARELFVKIQEKE